MRCSKCKNSNHNRRTCGKRTTTAYARNKKTHPNPQRSQQWLNTHTPPTLPLPHNAGLFLKKRPALPDFSNFTQPHRKKEKTNTEMGQPVSQNGTKIQTGADSSYSVEDYETLINMKFPELTERNTHSTNKEIFNTKGPAAAQMLHYMQSIQALDDPAFHKALLKTIPPETVHILPMVLYSLAKKNKIEPQNKHTITEKFLHYGTPHLVAETLKYETVSPPVSTLKHISEKYITNTEVLTQIVGLKTTPPQILQRIAMNLESENNATAKHATLLYLTRRHPNFPHFNTLAPSLPHNSF